MPFLASPSCAVGGPVHIDPASPLVIGTDFDDPGRHRWSAKAFGPTRLIVSSSLCSVLGVWSEMREPTFLLLTTLTAGPRHGYAIISDVLELSDGSIRLQAGTLYAALDRLRAEDLVTVSAEEVVQGRLRRYFSLTEKGVAVLGAEAERRRAVTDRTLARLKKLGPVLPS